MLSLRAPFRCALAALAVQICLLFTGCGYHLDGFGSYGGSSHNVLGDGTGTLKVAAVEHNLLYPWISYYVRGLLRDEVNLRRLGRWVDTGDADYLITVSVPGFRARSSVSNRDSSTMLNVTTVQLELIVRNGKTGSVAWRSGVISYQDWHETIDQDEVLRNGLAETMRRALDRMQQKF